MLVRHDQPVLECRELVAEVWACAAHLWIAFGRLEVAAVLVEGTLVAAGNLAAAEDTDPAVAAAADTAGYDRHAAGEAGQKHHTVAC